MQRRFHLIPERHGRTDGRIDGQTEFLYQYRTSVCIRAIKKPRIVKFAARTLVFITKFNITVLTGSQGVK